MAEFLELDSRYDFDIAICQTYNRFITTALTNHFESKNKENDLHTLVQHLIDFIIKMSYPLTINLYNIFTCYQQKQEVANKFCTNLKAEEIKKSTNITNKLLEKDEKSVSKNIERLRPN